jgi:hypothetical protein
LTAAIEVAGVDKPFPAGTPVLSNVRFTIASGEMAALIGASGLRRLHKAPFASLRWATPCAARAMTLASPASRRR